MVCKGSASAALEHSGSVLEWETRPPPCPEMGWLKDEGRFSAQLQSASLKDKEVQVSRGLGEKR
jgi:hypothetical protein